MVKQCTATPGLNRFRSWLARRGVGRTEVMTATGRKSGRTRQVPVSPTVLDGVEYVVSPYGEVGWVHNVRANPEVVLRHGSRERRVRLEEVRVLRRRRRWPVITPGRASPALGGPRGSHRRGLRHPVRPVPGVPGGAESLSHRTVTGTLRGHVRT